MTTLRVRRTGMAGVLILATSICTACMRQPPANRMTGSQRVVTRLLLNNVWPPASPMACLVAHLEQGLSYRQAIDACQIDLKGAAVGATIPGGLGAFPVLVPKGSKTPTTAACVSVPSRGGLGPPRADAGSDDEDLPDLPTKEDLETQRQVALAMAADILRRMKEAEADAAKVAFAALYQTFMNEAFRADYYLNKDYNVPRPKYPYKRTVQGAESACQQVNGFVAQCDDSKWASSECRALLDAINGCANSEVSRVEGEESCKPVDPGTAVVAAILEAECSKLARGNDGQNPCDRRPPQGSSPTQVVVERCKPPVDALVAPGSDPIPGQEECPGADLEKFLSMALPSKDLSFITSKIGGPRPSPGDDNPKRTGKPGGAPLP